ncbi:glycoside hydrolase family 2 TIM barrel-domain containing protein [Microbacterium sp. NPDC079995]|uniref:glycoside hydrolase family 2 protein n=1 Tax=unclassified Microbacterium TaxID=2609290 RepID=UPI00344EA770
MIRQLFNDGWTAGPKLGVFGTQDDGTVRKPVRLPHDGVRDLHRTADTPNGSHTGYYPGTHLSYEKTFEVPADWHGKAVMLEFEGVYRDAMVFVNGDLAGQRPSGYSAFELRLEPYLRFGEANTIRVEARTHQDSRWYTGGGIYRNTWLAVSEPVHLTLSGVRVTTPDIDQERAVVLAQLDVVNDTRHTRTVRVETQIIGPDGREAASASAPLTLLPAHTGTLHLRHYVRKPELWDVDDPNLYTLQTRVRDDELLDEHVTAFGIRRLQLDPIHGLRINGQSIKLRGGCIHHDNGPLGSAAIDRAEERRVEILKAAGYNAVRSAHNTLSRAFLEACDRYGMLVMDELSDVWTEGKAPFDYSLAFPEWWERDVESMIAKDFNHPSVILYSIGNEIFEVGRPIGSTWGRRLAEKVRALDPTRLVTNAINGMVAALDLAASANPGEPLDVNALIDSMEEGMNTLGSSEEVSHRTEEAHAQLDASGINYSESRYAVDAERHPDRILIGSETFPGALDRLWPLVEQYPTVLGDFAWTAWDYLGEAGIGRVVYQDEEAGGFGAAYPHLTAGSGTIDITGRLKPIAYWRQVVWGLRREPYIAVHRPQRHGQEVKIGPWSWHDALNSWTWNVEPGSPITVDVYTDAEEVELQVNGTTVGRARVGEDKAFIARIETTFSPGTVIAVAYRNGEEVGRSTLETARGDLRLHASADRQELRADGTDLAYVEISIGDDAGVVHNDVEEQILVALDGPAVLAGFASAAPATEERFDAERRSTHDGRVLAVIRPTGSGNITLTATAEGLLPATVEITAAH